MFTIACCLVEGLGLGLGLGLDLGSGWLVVICTRICATLGCHGDTAVDIASFVTGKAQWSAIRDLQTTMNCRPGHPWA